MQTRTTTLPKPDSRGRIRPTVGRLKTGKVFKLTVGDKHTAPAEAQRRLDLIKLLFAKQCERYGKDYWVGWGKGIAVALGKYGVVNDVCLGEGVSLKQRAQDVELLRSWGIPVEIHQPKHHAQGLMLCKDELETMIHQLIQERLVASGTALKNSIPENPMVIAESATLHEVIDARSSYLKIYQPKNADGSLKQRTRKSMNRLNSLKEHHENLPMFKLDYMTVDKMFIYWRNRPQKKAGGKMSVSHCVDMIKEIDTCLRWINTNSDYQWELPKNYQEINRRVHKPKSKPTGKFKTITKPTYNPKQLAFILKHADPFRKALIALCVNCAFGQGEIGQWHTDGFKLHTKHDEAERIGFESDANDSWVIGERPKTDCYGEHLLWPEVANAIKPFLDGREVFPINSKGNPWYNLDSSNPRSVIDRRWREVIDKCVADDKDFPKLSFGSLRDTLPNILRARYENENLASLALQHQTPSSDKLLECYANLPFAQFFNATRELKEYFQPMLDELK